jgi:hypothetical protein
LDPLSWRHYFLLLYWVFFRPTALKCYLYQADPELYRGEGESRLKRAMANPAYRQLVVVSIGSLVVVAIFSIILQSLFVWHSTDAGRTLASVVGVSTLFHAILPGVVSEVASGVASGVAWGALGVAWGVGVGVLDVASGVAFGVAFGVALGVAMGVALGMVYLVASVVALGVAVGVAFGVAVGVAFGVAWGVAFGVAFGVALGVAHGLAVGVALGISSIFGSFRLPFYLVEAAELLFFPRRLSHPVWWDELAVLPFFGTNQTINRAWRVGETGALISLVRLASNPFQRWVLQRTLVRHLHISRDPILFMYRLLRLQELDVYAHAPLLQTDWKEIPSVRQVYLAEIAAQGGDRSDLLERVVFRLTQPLRLTCHTPLTALAGVLHAITQLEDSTAREPDSKPLPLALSGSLFDSLLEYPGGSELQSSFACISHCLQATSLAELTKIPSLLGHLPHARDAIRPEVIDALQRLGPISQNIAVAKAASSRLNQLAAFARATEAIEELGPFIEQTVVVPEKLLLLRIRNHWRTLVAEAGGRLGAQVQHKRVVNPYVAGNPVKGGLFVGRDEILGQLEELWLKPGQVDSLVLYGHRRMGKSSILQNLPHRLDPASNWVVDFNLQTVNRSHTGSLLFDLASKMHDAVLRHPNVQTPATTSAEWTVPEESAFRANYQRAFSQWLDRLAPLVAGRRFIIAVDEYELLEKSMAEGSLDAQLTLFLRGVIQSRDWFVLALAGLYTLQEQCHNYWHPLFASIKPRKVSFLSPAATRRLLTQPSDDFPLDYTPDTLDAIYALTHGQPYLVQLIGQNIVAHYNRQVLDGERQPDQPLSLNDLEAIIASTEFLQDGLPYYDGVWAQANAKDSPPGQHPVLYALTTGPASLAHLAKLTALPVEEVTAALSTLEAHDVINLGNDGAYSFTVELMRRWVGQRLPPGSSSVA